MATRIRRRQGLVGVRRGGGGGGGGGVRGGGGLHLTIQALSLLLLLLVLSTTRAEIGSDGKCSIFIFAPFTVE